MSSSVRRRLTYANVIVTFALVFAMSGGAYAASKYLITTTKQISPKVLKALVGKTGKAGAVGPIGPTGAVGSAGGQGPAGPQGKEGAQGKEGPQGEPGKNGTNGKEGKEGAFGGQTLPPGKTLKGHWAASSYGETGISEPAGAGIATTAVSFALALSSVTGINEVIVNEGETRSECPGSVTEPGAEPGFLCAFISSTFNALEGKVAFANFDPNGFTIYSYTKAKGRINIEGTWAVTAPTQ